ncbi:diguanylate cyclase domain-containing protein [Sulfurimonas sp.]
MWKFYHRLNIEKKLNFMSLSTALMAGIIAIVFISIYQYIDGKKNIAYTNQTLTKILAQNIAPALLFKDVNNIQASLSSLKYEKNIVEAYALLDNGEIIGRYTRERLFKPNPLIKNISLEPKQFWNGFRLYTITPIKDDANSIGFLITVYTMNKFISYLLMQMLFIALIIITSIVLTFKYFKILSRDILIPISHLNKSTTQIIKTKTLNTEVKIYNNDEIGLLAKNFNIMIKELSKYHEELSKQKDLLSYKANHDELTDLPNRALFNDRLTVAINRSDRNSGAISVFFLDIDYFKQINDKYGHDVGDEILKRFAVRLQSCLRAEDTLARIGGDEFMIILQENENMTTSITVANKIVDAMKEPIELGETQLMLSTSIGIAIYPSDAASASELVKNADLAMYKAKEAGRNNFKFFEQK